MEETQGSTTYESDPEQGAARSGEQSNDERPPARPEPGYPAAAVTLTANGIPELYAAIPKLDYDEINAKYKLASWKAKDAHQQSEIDAKTARTTAESAFNIAKEKRQSDTRRLENKIVSAKEQLFIEYDKCLHGAKRPSCKGEDTEAPEEKTAVCVAKLKKVILEQDAEYEKQIRAIEQAFADAERSWAKAQEQYDAALGVADKAEAVACEAARVEMYTALEKALEACKV